MWESIGGGFSEGFKNASTGLDGNQYFVPFYYYPWAVHYRKSVFAEHGYEVPTTWDEFKALCDQMQTDGLIPLAAANDGNWPQMGMFDMLNLRINGYDFHVSLMGGQESWTDDRVKAIFTAWEEILPYYQPDANGRTWQDAATTIGNSEAGMMLLGTFLVRRVETRNVPSSYVIPASLLPIVVAASTSVRWRRAAGEDLFPGREDRLHPVVGPALLAARAAWKSLALIRRLSMSNVPICGQLPSLAAASGMSPSVCIWSQST